MPPKKVKKPRAKRAPAKKRGTKQKQKQRQVVNVQVSGGGSGGGGTQFIPMPQAPSIDYSLLSQLIRPANTVDVPIREAAPMAEPIAVRPAEEPTLVEMATQTGPLRAAPPIPSARKVRSDAGKSRKVPIAEQMTEREAGYESFPSSEGEQEVRNVVRKQEKKSMRFFEKYGGGGGGPFM